MHIVCSKLMRMNKNIRYSGFADIQHMIFFEVSIGITGNTVLLLFHVLTFFVELRPKPTDLTIGHLAFIQMVALLTVGFIAMDNLGYQLMGNDITCASVIYLYRLMRGLSICTTCVLSVLQAITLSPRSSCLAKFKQKSLCQKLCCFFFLWAFNMVISSRFFISTVATPNVTSPSLMSLTKSCSHLPESSLLRNLYDSLTAFEYTSCIGLMTLSSGYMVIVLCRHKRQSQHLHSTSLSPKASPEQRATQTILLLMSFFIFMYSIECVMGLTFSIPWKNALMHHCIVMLVGNVYAMISPLLLISTEKRIIKYLLFMLGKDSE